MPGKAKRGTGSSVTSGIGSTRKNWSGGLRLTYIALFAQNVGSFFTSILGTVEEMAMDLAGDMEETKKDQEKRGKKKKMKEKKVIFRVVI